MSSRTTYHPSGLKIVEGTTKETTWAIPTTTVQEKQTPSTKTGFFASLIGKKTNSVAPAPQGGKKKAAPKKKAAVKAAGKKAAKAAPKKTK